MHLVQFIKAFLSFYLINTIIDYVVQPLPVTNFSAELTNEGKVHLNWKSKPDELEPTAIPEKYIVYTKLNDDGFDNGKLVDTNQLVIDNIEEGKIYSYKVTAFNKGGESFPSEILSVCWLGENSKIALIVNGFDRVSPAASFESKTFSGFTDFIDEGVPYKYDLGYSGSQYNFDPDSKWETDDKPGHGASSSDYETKIIAGNTFNFPYVHGKALMQNGLSFCSVSKASINGWEH